MKRERPDGLPVDELARAAGYPNEAAALRMLQRVGIPPIDAGGGRGVKRLFHRQDVIVLRALRRLEAMGCPDVWLSAVGSWWAHPEQQAAAAGTARYLVVAPSRQLAPVFLTNRYGIGDVLAGCHAWVVDLADERVYRKES